MMPRLPYIRLVLLLALACVNMMACGGEKKEETTASAQQSGKPVDDLLTARQTLPLAIGAAQNWASDAALVELSTFPKPPETDGRGCCWKFEFNSPTLDKELEVHVRRGKIFQTMEGKLIQRQAITGEWIDSPKAVQLAAEYFVEIPEKQYWLGLSVSEQSPVWRIKCSGGPGEPTWVKIDALTGKKLDTWRGQ